MRSNQAEFRSNVWHCGTPEPEPEPYRVLRKRLREALMLVIIGLARVDYEQRCIMSLPIIPRFMFYVAAPSSIDGDVKNRF